MKTNLKIPLANSIYVFRRFDLNVSSVIYDEINPRPTGGGYFEPLLSFSCDIF